MRRLYEKVSKKTIIIGITVFISVVLLIMGLFVPLDSTRWEGCYSTDVVRHDLIFGDSIDSLKKRNSTPVTIKDGALYATGDANLCKNHVQYLL